MTKMLLMPDQHVRVSLRVKLEDGAEWLRVSKIGGMEGWVPADSIAIEVNVEEHRQQWGGELAPQQGGTSCGWKSFRALHNDSSLDSRGNSFQNANPQGC